MHKLAWRLAAAAGGLLALPALAEVRTWTDVSGRTMQAEYIRAGDGEATFLRDGKLVAVPLERLSEADQKLIRALDAAREANADSAIPAAAKPLPVPPEAAAHAPDSAAASSPPVGQPINAPLSAAAPFGAKQPAAPQIREWTDLKGNQTRARFVRVNAGNVILLRGGRIVSLPYDSLSVVDREYVRELLAARGEAHLIPPPPEEENRSPSSDAPPAVPAPVASAPAGLPPVVPDEPPGAGGPRDPLAELQERQQELDAMQRAQQEPLAQSAAAAAARASQAAERQQAVIERQPGANRQTLVGTCSNCKNPLSDDQMRLGTCSHCGVVWQYEVDPFGNRRELPTSGTSARSDSQSGDSSFDEPRPTIRSFRPVGRLVFRVILPAMVGLGAVGAGAVARSRR